ncbi:MAG: PepSY domain-containing protein [Hyphomonadaceae bacterium]|nr:PepSY domain-containing protein [Hyphomonadaceae bacterium]
MQRNHPFKLLLPFLLFATAALAACSHDANVHGDPALAAQAVVSLERAQELALAARPGEVREWELEREHGGLRYSFDIAVGATLFEVGVDAATGAIVENGLEH